MSFFKTVASLCSGVSVFLKLLSVPLWRMLLHTIMMMLICTLIITTVTWMHDKEKINSVAERFFQKTDGIVLTEQTLSIPRDPDLVRHYVLSENFRFDYFPAPENVDLQCIESSGERTGVICMPAGCIVWARDENMQHRKCMYIVLPVNKIYH